jgi:hypothetical protein
MGLRRLARQARRLVLAFLLDYAAGTHVRASEAAFFDTRDSQFKGSGAGAWLGNNVARIFADGSILIEDARTNQMDYSEDFSFWTLTGTGTETGSQATPDGGGDGWRLEDTDSGAATQWARASGALNAAAHVASLFVLKDADTSRFPSLEISALTATISGGTFAVDINTSTGATATRLGTPNFVRVDDAGDWWRLVIGFTVTVAGTVQPTFYPAVGTVIGTLSNAALGAATPWGMQVEEGGLASSPIRTAGATVTRAKDDHMVPQAAVDAALYSVGFTVDVWLPSGTGSNEMAPSQIFNTNSSSRNYLRLFPQTTTESRVFYRSATSAAFQSLNYTATINTKHTMRVEHQVENVYSLDDVVEDTEDISTAPDAWIANDLAVGQAVGGTLTSFAVISRPRPL